MYNLNQSGTIYHGTKLLNLEKILQGFDKPLERNEPYISVSVSGYHAPIPLTGHEDLSFLGKIFHQEYQAAVIDETHRLLWKTGYRNSLTFIDGFGPNDGPTYHCFGEKVPNTRQGENITLVIDRQYQNELLFPETPGSEPGMEYLTLALHPFIKEIQPHMIQGFIADQFNFSELKQKLSRKNIQKPIWLVEEIE